MGKTALHPLPLDREQRRAQGGALLALAAQGAGAAGDRGKGGGRRGEPIPHLGSGWDATRRSAHEGRRRWTEELAAAAMQS